MRRLDPWLLAGLTLCGLLLLVAAYGDRIAPHEPIYLLINGPAGTERPLPPGEPFLLGSDAVGRDLLSLVLVGARTTLAIVALAGMARLVAGLALAVLGSWVRPVRLLLDAAADIVSAVPSTIVAVFAVLVFARQGAPAFVFVGALLITGWAGPYRLIRAELARLRAAPYTEGAIALGVGRRAIFARHHLPHLVPVLAVSASQQIAAALVAIAELGVIGIFVGPTRMLNVAEAMRVLPEGVKTSFTVPDVPEWGGLLALARGIQSLYITRWEFLVPGVAIAIAAIGFTLLGVGLARQYRRRNLIQDLRSRRTLIAIVAVALLLGPAFVLPAPHADARGLGAAARGRAVVGIDTAAVLAEAHLAITPVDRTSTQVQQVGPALLEVDLPSGPRSYTEGARADFAPLLIGAAGGGSVDAPLVFAGWGISPNDFPPAKVSVFGPDDFGTAVSGWEDDYAKVDVRGKAVLIFRLPSLRVGLRSAPTPTPDMVMASAIKRGAVAILWVDQSRAQLIARGLVDPYRRLVSDDPIQKVSGVPIFTITADVADQLLAPVGVRATDVLRAQLQGDPNVVNGVSMARPLPERAHLDLPLASVTSLSHSLVALTPAPAGAHRLVIWAVAPSLATGSRSAADVLSAVVSALEGRAVPPLAFVLFDPRGDAPANAKAVRSVLGPVIVDDVIAVDSVLGTRLLFASAYADLVPMIDAYAGRVGANAARTPNVVNVDAGTTGDLLIATGLSAFLDAHWVLVTAEGPATDATDLRPDAAAVVAYAVGRYAAGAAELVR